MIKADPIFICFMAVLIVASVIDIRSFRVPNWLTYPTLAAGISYFGIAQGYDGLLFSSGGAAAGFGLLFIPYLFGGTGAGDVKLLAAVGSFLGPRGVFAVFMISCILSGVFAIFLLASKGLLPRTFARYGRMLWEFMHTLQFAFIQPSHEEKQIKISHGLSIALGTGSYLAFWT